MMDVSRSSFWIQAIEPKSPIDLWWNNWCENPGRPDHRGHINRYVIIGIDVGIWN